MFDCARIAALAWAFARALRARAFALAILLAVVAYLLALEIASGIAVRNEGPLPWIYAGALALLGPSGMPRGHLPPLPLAAWVAARPATMHALKAAALAIPVRSATARAAAMPSLSEEGRRLDDAALAALFVAICEGICAATRLLPLALDRDF